MLALNILKICLQNQIDLTIQWIPKEENEIADYISKIRDLDAWGVSPEFCHVMYDKYDLIPWMYALMVLTPCYLGLIPVFFCHPLSEGVDAFTRLWEGGNNWLVPPVSLVKRAILHSVTCRAECTLVVPFWPSSPFWSSIFDRDGSVLCHRRVRIS